METISGPRSTLYVAAAFCPYRSPTPSCNIQVCLWRTLMMRISDIQSGRIHTIEVERSDRTSFDGQEVLSIKNEVFLHRDQIGNDILLVRSEERRVGKECRSRRSP